MQSLILKEELRSSRHTKLIPIIGPYFENLSYRMASLIDSLLSLPTKISYLCCASSQASISEFVDGGDGNTSDFSLATLLIGTGGGGDKRSDQPRKTKGVAVLEDSISSPNRTKEFALALFGLSQLMIQSG